MSWVCIQVNANGCKNFVSFFLHHIMKGIRTIDGSTLPQGCVKEQLCWPSVGHEVIGFIKHVMKKSDLVRSQSM